jgi:16S rRNA (guanine966-N2)-methyltransferase
VTDKVKSAIFSSLGDRVIGAVVLDLYGGSGALGVEALSRGANKLDVVDSSHAAQKAIQTNLTGLNLTTQAKLYRQSVDAFLKSTNGPYDLIFFDPPYADFDLELVASLANLLQYSGLVVVSCSSKTELPAKVGELNLVQQKVYGDTKIGYFEKSDRAS